LASNIYCVSIKVTISTFEIIDYNGNQFNGSKTFEGTSTIPNTGSISYTYATAICYVSFKVLGSSYTTNSKTITIDLSAGNKWHYTNSDYLEADVNSGTISTSISGNITFEPTLIFTVDISGKIGNV
jgi:hypothetical protein